MDLNQLQAAASYEHSAEQDRATAEAAWRKAWWRTTVELAMVDQHEVGAAYDLAAGILGQSVRWMGTRRATGQYLMDNLTVSQLETLAPRLTVEYVKGKADPARAYDVLTAAEAEGTSIRELARQLGTQPKSWLREDEQDASSTAERVARMDVHERVAIARSILADDDAAELVVGDRDSRERIFGGFRRHNEREALNRPVVQPREPSALEKADDDWGDTLDNFMRITEILDAELAHLQASDLIRRDHDYRVAVKTHLEALRNRLDLLDAVAAGPMGPLSTEQFWAEMGGQS